MLRIEVLDVREFKKGQILALCNVELTSEEAERVIIIDARVMQDPNGQLWVAYTERPVKNRDGSPDYVPIIRFSQDLKRRISDAVLDAYSSSLCAMGSKLGSKQRN